MEQQKKILVADDEPNITLSLKYLFEDRNYSVIRAENGSEALEKAREFMPNLIILDIMMPRSAEFAGHLEKDGGIRICEKLKQDDATSHIPIIVLTVKGGITDREVAKNVGADEYITKPFNTNDLLSKVEKLLG